MGPSPSISRCCSCSSQSSPWTNGSGSPFWIVVGFVFLAERVITAWRGGWRARLLAAALFPELGYDVFLQVVFVKCLLDIALAKRTTWGHAQHRNETTAA